VLVYEDKSDPVIEYWINEGADILIGGRRSDGGFLSLEECKNTATFPEPEEHVDLEVEKATLGVVSAWGEDEKNVLYFNDEELGEGVYCGYHDPCIKEEEGISMSVGIEGETCEAQVGIAVFDVTDELEDEDNVAIQGDDGDCMMPVNAFLVKTYEEGEEEFFDTGSPANPYPSIFGTHNGTITPKYNITVSRMYTYACEGTGGHSEYIEIWNATGWTVNASWNGYKDNWHNISFDVPFTLESYKTYNYTIRTGSYPQIHHRDELEVRGGIITCTKFVDANGKVYSNWIPAIRLE
jgi:hypothetical protein